MSANGKPRRKTAKIILADELGLAYDYIDRCHNKHHSAKCNAATKGVEFNLTLREYVSLMDEAGITVDDIGCSINNYNLGRIGDSGPYMLGNCRFITVEQNIRERVHNGGAKIGGVVGGLARRGRTARNHDGVASMANKMSKYWKVTTPEGVSVYVHNLCAYASDNSLTVQCMYPQKCAFSMHKGYKTEEIDKEEFENNV
ncbi:hypothetical protein NVP1244A_021 [Vibrio phage 1.244.A._10N.261.54.C3]|nr:hypothetical protein NVP1244A_021 [Vibrio phage 1.244.A._10N.261.54.C3]AUR98649.1 hypothetical protein NVP1255O_021 [Vibrio phage 1.255.O._10N.286.45.F1]